jgi:hypothetical protein
MRHGLLAVFAALALSACAEGYYGPYGGGGMAYYDDFYGSYYDGYWGSDGFFYFRHGHEHGFIRDEGRHFRRGPGQGFHGVHAHPGFHGFHHGGGGHVGHGVPGPARRP